MLEIYSITMPYFDREYPKNLLDKSCKLSAVLNLLTICFGIAYFIIPVHSIMLDIFGVILFASWLMNIFIIYVVDKYLVKSTEKGRKINIFLFYYIGFFLIGILLMVMSVAISNFLMIGVGESIIFLIVSIDMLVGLLGIAALGVYLSILTYTNLEKTGVFIFE